jgi:hypothetical protein
MGLSTTKLGASIMERENGGIPMTESTGYRLTIEDHDRSWVEDRAADVHGAPARTGDWWTDRDGRRVEGYEPGGSCGGCGWRPDDGDPMAVAGSRQRVSLAGRNRVNWMGVAVS